MPDFTMIAFAGFVDTLRLAADEGDRSRQVRIAWSVLSEDGGPVRASNGVTVRANGDLGDPARFDYIVVVGGTLHEGPRETARLIAFLRAADAVRLPLVGLCTGSLTLARAGLMDGHVACVNWFHHDDYAAEFPRHRLVSDRLFVDDGRRITCAGGVSVVDVASYLIERHLGPGAADKGRRIILEEAARAGSAPQPGPREIALPQGTDARIRRAVLLMERRLCDPLTLADLAEAARASERTLARLFVAQLGETPMRMLRRLRLDRAQRLIGEGGLTLTRIAAECGFADASHLARAHRATFGRTPRSPG